MALALVTTLSFGEMEEITFQGEKVKKGNPSHGRTTAGLLVFHTPHRLTGFFHGKQTVNIAVTPAQAPVPC